MARTPAGALQETNPHGHAPRRHAFEPVIAAVTYVCGCPAFDNGASLPGLLSGALRRAHLGSERRLAIRKINAIRQASARLAALP